MDRLTAVAMSDPQYPRPLGIHDHRGVAVSRVQSKLVRHQAAYVARFEGPDLCFQMVPVQCLERPVRRLTWLKPSSQTRKR
ncbi:hypothetical protein A7D27_25100 [Pseudomonas sp. 1D4]|nr:hypothetical protein A7D27_25100 [Pseudomonas sp. 1D4]OEC56223.1 hypothetical protein A9G05_16705 [Pseudomonas sp. ENNP23]